MDNLTVFASTAGALSAFVLGVGLLVLAFRDPPQRSGPAWWARLDPRPAIAQRRRLSIAVGVGLAAGIASGWPVAALGAGLAVWFAPLMFGGDVAEQARIERVEALAVWSEILRDTLSSAAGLEQAVLASTGVAPDAIAGPLAVLGADLRARRPFDEAMYALASALADDTADQVIKALVYAQRNAVKNLAELLGELAAVARAKVSLAVRVHAERGRHRTAQRAISVMFALMAAGMALFESQFLRPYGTAAGQLALLVLLGMFGGAMAWGRAIVKPRPAPRLLDPNASEAS